MAEPLPSKIAKSIVPREIRYNGILETIHYLKSLNEKLHGSESSQDSPIFILSAGWRSGSTLLQRLICSDKNILIWGEPFGDRIPICRLSSTIKGLTDTDAHFKYSIDQFNGDIEKSWVANLNPGPKALYKAHKAFFDSLFANTAFERGFTRWGCKWVRLTAFHAEYLKWLYPNAKILLLIRNPMNAYLSYKNKKWFTVKPHYKVNNVVKFMAHWRYLTDSFLSEKKRAEAILILYENIIKGKNFEMIEKYLEVKLNKSVLSKKIGIENKSKLRLNFYEKLICTYFSYDVLKKLQPYN